MGNDKNTWTYVIGGLKPIQTHGRDGAANVCNTYAEGYARGYEQGLQLECKSPCEIKIENQHANRVRWSVDGVVIAVMFPTYPYLYEGENECEHEVEKFLQMLKQCADKFIEKNSFYLDLEALMHIHEVPYSDVDRCKFTFNNADGEVFRVSMWTDSDSPRKWVLSLGNKPYVFTENMMQHLTTLMADLGAVVDGFRADYIDNDN